MGAYRPVPIGWVVERAGISRTILRLWKDGAVNNLPSATQSDSISSAGVEAFNSGAMAINCAGLSPEIVSNERDVLKDRIQQPGRKNAAFAELLQNGDAESIRAAVDAYNKMPGGPGRFSSFGCLPSVGPS